VTESDIILTPGPTITAKCTAATNIVATKQVTNAVTTTTTPAYVTITKTSIYTATMTLTCIPPSSLTSSQLPPTSLPAMRHRRPTPAPYREIRAKTRWSYGCAFHHLPPGIQLRSNYMCRCRAHVYDHRDSQYHHRAPITIKSHKKSLNRALESY
jgi:hypothetical protein